MIQTSLTGLAEVDTEGYPSLGDKLGAFFVLRFKDTDRQSVTVHVANVEEAEKVLAAARGAVAFLQEAAKPVDDTVTCSYCHAPLHQDDDGDWCDDDVSPTVCGFAPAGMYRHRPIQGDDEHEVVDAARG